MSLGDWLRNNWLHPHSTSPEEVRALLHSADVDLQSAQVDGIDAGWRLNMAYTAALRCARAALYACGYRPGKEREHERTIDSLGHTVVAPENTIRLLHVLRKKRHTAIYESVEVVSDVEAQVAMSTASELLRQVRAWLKANHPALIDR